MKNFEYLGSVCFIFAAALPLAGCEVDAGLDVGPDVVVEDDGGSLTLDIAVDGREDGRVCGEMGIAAADIRIIDDAGEILADEQFDCEAFGGSIDLPDGIYRAEVTLVDANDEAMSDEVIVRGLAIDDDTDLDVSVDVSDAELL